MGWLFGPNPRDVSAWHEAHHAAAAVALGGRLRTVWIAKRGFGGATHEKRSVFDVFGNDLTSRSDNLRYTIAGPLGQSLRFGGSLTEALDWGKETEGSDFSWVQKLIGRDSLGKWERRTKRLLAGYGGEIQDLRDALLDCGRVDGPVAVRILKGRR